MPAVLNLLALHSADHIHDQHLVGGGIQRRHAADVSTPWSW